LELISVGARPYHWLGSELINILDQLSTGDTSIKKSVKDPITS